MHCNYFDDTVEKMKKFSPKVSIYAFPSFRESERISYGANEQTRITLKRISKDCGWSLSGLLTLCLDQFCQFYERNPYPIKIKEENFKKIRGSKEKQMIILRVSKPLLKRLDKIAKENEITRKVLVDHVVERMESINKISFL